MGESTLTGGKPGSGDSSGSGGSDPASVGSEGAASSGGNTANVENEVSTDGGTPSVGGSEGTVSLGGNSGYVGNEVGSGGSTLSSGGGRSSSGGSRSSSGGSRSGGGSGSGSGGKSGGVRSAGSGGSAGSGSSGVAGSTGFGGSGTAGSSLASGGNLIGGSSGSAGKMGSGGAGTGGGTSTGSSSDSGGSHAGGSPSSSSNTRKRNGVPCPYDGHVSYTLARSSNPSSAETQAYNLIATAMDKALSYYNCYTDISKELYVSYNSSVATADGNINGSIRFGGTGAMEYITAMHEIAHTVGVGTASNWQSFVRFSSGGSSGPWTGAKANAELRAITGNSADTLTADRIHFWPYGLNYTSEAKSEADVINHCRIVVALRKDMGL